MYNLGLMFKLYRGNKTAYETADMNVLTLKRVSRSFFHFYFDILKRSAEQVLSTVQNLTRINTIYWKIWRAK